MQIELGDRIRAGSVPKGGRLVGRAKPAGLGRIVGLLVDAVRAHAWPIHITAIYVVFGTAVAAHYGIQTVLSPWIYVDLFEFMAFAIAWPSIIAYLIYVITVERPPKPIGHIASNLRRFVSPERAATVLPVVFVFPVFAATFTSLKSLIPKINPYHWDVPLSKLSLAVHGGYHPWQWLQPVFGYPLITRALDLVYVSWYPVLCAVLLWQILSQRDRMLRLQFFTTLMLSWILLGTVAATVISSAGPCFFGRITGLADPYAPLMDYLHAVSKEHRLFAITAQDYLWRLYQEGRTDIGSGISAMPSMHVSMVTLYALLGWRRNRWLGAAFTAYAVLLFIGSIELGWHYAVDGYAAALGTGLIWYGVGWLQQRKGALRQAGSAGVLADTPPIT